MGPDVNYCKGALLATVRALVPIFSDIFIFCYGHTPVHMQNVENVIAHVAKILKMEMSKRNKNVKRVESNCIVVTNINNHTTQLKRNHKS